MDSENVIILSEDHSLIFSGKALMIPDVKDLFTKKEEQIKEEAQTEQNPGSDDAGGVAPNVPKRGRFWQRDRSLANAISSATAQAQPG